MQAEKLSRQGEFRLKAIRLMFEYRNPGTNALAKEIFETAQDLAVYYPDNMEECAEQLMDLVIMITEYCEEFGIKIGERLYD